MSGKVLVSIVTPVFNEIEVIELFYDRVRKAMEALDSMAYELIFVDDGSTDGSYEKLVALANNNSDTKIIKFSRNFGHQIAITAGIDLATGDAVVVIDADLQDPPEVIKEFVAKWQEGYDVVYGVRVRRDGESRMKLATAAAFYRLLQRIIKVDIPVDVGDFRLMSRRVVDYFRFTDSPRRLKPIGIYYHFYSGTKTAAIKALHDVYAWAREQETFPVWASEYAASLYWS